VRDIAAGKMAIVTDDAIAKTKAISLWSRRIWLKTPSISPSGFPPSKKWASV
jgi:hypothetical protein